MYSGIGDKMSRTTRGKRDGTGPHKNSAQHKATGSKGKRQLAGQKCPKKVF